MTLGNDLLRFDKTQKYLIYDMETTGLNKGFSLPWQVSWVTFTLKDMLEEHDHYIWWDNLKMSKGAAEKTRFDAISCTIRNLLSLLIIQKRILQLQARYSAAIC